MRLLVIGHTYMEWLGRRKYEAFARLTSNVEITIITPERWPDSFRVLRGQPFNAPRIRITPLPAALPGYGSRYVLSPWRLASELRQSRPDIVFVEQEPWSMVYLQALGTSFVALPGAKVGFFTWANVPRGLSTPFALLEQVALRRTNFAVAGNHAAVELLRARGYSGAIKLVPQIGVDIDHFQNGSADHVREQFNPFDGPTIAYVGRLVEEKGLLTLIRALGHLRDLSWQMLFVGSGDLESRLLAEARELGIDGRLAFTGAVLQESIRDYLAGSSILVLPSERTPRWREQFGHVLIESMAARVPVVGSDSGEIPFVIGDAGLVFPERDVAVLARHLRDLLTSPTRRAELAERGLRRVKAMYSEEAVARALHSFFQDVLTSPGAAASTARSQV